MKTGTAVIRSLFCIAGFFFPAFFVGAIGQVPIVSDIPDQIIDEGQPFAAIKLDDYVTDIDNTTDQITWSISSPLDLSVNIDDNRMAVITTPSPDWNGVETITFTATDPDMNSNSDDATFRVKPVNDPPLVSGILDQLFAEGTPFQPVNLDDYVTDVDNTKDQLLWSASGFTNITVAIDPLSHIATLGTPNEDWNGSEDLIFTATDTSSASGNDTANYTLTPVNDPPAIGNIPGQTIQEGQLFNPISLDNYVTDVDNTKSELAWTVTGNTDLLASIDPSRVANITVPAHWSGTENLTFAVKDPSDASASDAALFKVTALAAPPVAGNDNYSVDEGATLNVSAPGVLSNDTDEDLDPITAIKLTDPAHGTLTLNSDGSFTYVHDGSETTSDVFTYYAWDGASQSNTATVTITITPVNDAPVLATIEGSALSYTEGDGLVQITNTITVSDVDNTTLSSATISISANYQSSQDVLAFTNANGITGSWNSGTGVLTLSGIASMNNYRNALRSVRYSNTSLNPNTSTRTITFTVNDGTDNSNAQNRDITITAINNAPVLAGIEGTALAYTEGDGLVQITNTITVSDVDNTSLSSATISISANYQSSQDVLAFTNANGITGSWNSGTGVLTLSGTATLSNYQTALRSVRYNNTSVNPNTSSRTITFRVNDGTDNSNAQNRNITVTASNSAPVLAGIEGTALAYTEGDGLVQITNTIAVSDVDNTTLSSATISISANYQSSQDVLAFTNANGITGSWNSGTGVLTLSGTATLSNYQTALRSVRYNNTSLNPNTSARTITFSVNDGIDNSNTQNRDITITATNNAPVLAGIEGTALVYTEGDGLVQITNTITVTDVDNTSLSSATISISANYQSSQDVLAFTNANGITGSWNSGTGILTLSGTATLSNYRTALRSVRYNNTSLNPNISTRTITFIVNDGTDNSNSQNRNITVSASNSAPVLANLEGSALSYTEGDSPVLITSTVTVSDVDNTNLSSAIIAISSNYQSDQDVLSFTNANGITGSWNSGTGILTLSGTATLSNYQTALRSVRYNNTSLNPNASTRTTTFSVNDGIDNSNTQNRDITITATNSAPLLANIEGTALAYTEGDSPVQITNTITVSDVDNTTLSSAIIAISSNYQSDQDVLSFTNANGITGSWNAGTGQLTLSGIATLSNYRTALRSVRYNNTSLNPDASTRTITFSVNDGTDNSNSQNRNITVTASNSAPVLANIEGTVVAFTEGDSPVQITSAITVSDVDNTTLSSAIITISSNYQSDQDVLSFTNANGISGSWNSGTGTLALSGISSLANYQTALKSIQYSNTSENPSVLIRVISFTVNDGSSPSNTVTRNIAITRVDDIPVIDNIPGSSLNFTEDSPRMPIASTLIVTDVDNIRMASATIRITTNYDSSEDSLYFTDIYPNITATWNTPREILLTGPDTKFNFQAALRAIQYKNRDTLNPSTLTRTVSFVIRDSLNVASDPKTRNITITLVNDPPVATAVSFIPASGLIGTVYTGTFSYSDPENNPQGTHLYRWYRSANASGLNAQPIAGATSITYTPQKADGHNYICFEVTPRDNQGAAGTPVKSAFRLINAVPVASNAVVYAPGNIPGQTIRGRFTYSDQENDPRGTAIYQWYRKTTNSFTPASPGIPIGTDSIYILRNADAGKYIWFKVKPVAITGSSPGDSVWSNIIGPIGSFSGNISGSAGYCSGSVMPITLSISGGLAPYSVVLTRSASALNKDTTITGINASPYIIQVRIPGNYVLKSLTDASLPDPDEGTVTSDPVVLSFFLKPSAVLTGSQGICNDGSSTAPLSLNLSGTAPWTFTIRRGSSNDTIYSGINADPYTLHARVIGPSPTTYRMIAISDAHCPGDTAGSGTARIFYKPSPSAIISGRDTICPSATGTLKVIFLNTTGASWSFTYLRNGANPTVVNNISSYSYDLTVAGVGVYTLSRVQDASCTGKVSGTGTVISYTLPTATLSGTATICEHTSGNLNVALTGTSPWKYAYRLNTETPVEVLNVSASPNTIPVKKAGTYTLTQVYDKQCQGTVSGSAVITVTPAPEVTISGLAPAYDKDYDQMVSITGTPAGGTFSGPGLFYSNPDWYFLPRYVPVGTHDIVYSYRQTQGSCYGYDTVVVRVLEANAVVEFPENRNKYCLNDAPFTITGANLANNIGSFSISGDVGLVDHHDNTATIDPSMLGINEYTVTYTYFDGTTLSVISKFEVGNPPVADFSWETECFKAGQSIKFKNTSTPSFGIITGSSWRIYTNTGYDTATTRDIVYTFGETGNHIVELQVQTSYGCSNSVPKVFDLRPTDTLSHPYVEDFVNEPLRWQSSSSGSLPINSWMLGDPSNDFSGIADGTYCWYTHIAFTNSPREQSWVTSPCFDFTDIKRPMLKLNVWRMFDSNRDGANLQFTADSGKTWTLLGQIGDGINWFNHYNILGNPGGSSVGWSDFVDDQWYESRHSLDMLKGKKNVQFRIAYGSDGTAHNNHGIAFDKIWIGDRNRITLLEHFTNASDDQSIDADLDVNNLVNADTLNIIDLQYHTSFPGDDPFNKQEPFVPGARVLYYGLPDVPYTILNGGSRSSHRFDYIVRQLNADTVRIESLRDSKFRIGIKSWITSNVLNIQTQISPREDIPASELTIHVAVIERKITGVTGNNGENIFESVVKTLLPDAAGTTLYRAWARDETKRIDDAWEMQNVYNTAELRVVAFIQDESTGEIFQAEIDTIGSVPTGIHDELPERGSDNNFIVFPNPASDHVFIRFEKSLARDARIELYNNLGGLVYSGRMLRGADETEIPTADCPDGFYIIRAITSDKVLGIKKLTITR
jgi:VCBS repeat-containing protein